MKIIHEIDGRSRQGFTLLEILLAVVVISILIAIIVPRAQRANVDAKYVGVRQAGVEIGRWGMDWATRNLESQDPGASCSLIDYVDTLLGYVGDSNAGDTRPNWIMVNEDLAPGCRSETEEDGITYSVAHLIDPASHPRNPFNGLSYFNTEGGNGSINVQAGLLYLGVIDHDDGARHYYFVFTGTNSEATDQWYAGMGQGTNLSYAQLRNGILMTRQVIPPAP
jgi:prepilin-type N-terminal cleavage/methylation domain-containing protein